MMSKMLKQPMKKIKSSRKIIIFPHKNIDGDALGSAYGLKLILQSMGKQVSVVTEEDYPHRLTEVVYAGGQDEPIEADLVIAVDCADLERLGERAVLLEKAGENTISFDHHKSNTNFATINCVMPKASSCGEVIYEFCCVNRIKVSAEAANNLYLAISSDTGGFRQSNVSSRTHEVAAELMKRGINAEEINRALFSSNSFERSLLVGEALRSLEFNEKTGVSYLQITKQQMAMHNGKQEDVDGLVNYARNIIGVKVAVFLREEEDGVKASLRSNHNEFDVSKICSKFGGGGHLRAAGCNFNVDIVQAKETILKEVERCIYERDTINK